MWRNNQHNDEERKITKDLEHMDNSDLNFWLKHFVVEVRKKDGEKYPMNSIFSLVMGLMSYLRLKCKKNLDIFHYVKVRMVSVRVMRAKT